MVVTDEQREVLLKDLSPSRVAKRSGGHGRQLSYLEAWDVKAHLNRIFGFCNWSADVLTADLAFEEQTDKGNWSVGYKVVLRLTIFAATYTEAAVGFSMLPSRGEAHDMAVKTAESDALKRAAINLGTQFGLSLYNDGSLKDVVRKVVGEESAPDPVLSEEVFGMWVDKFDSCKDRTSLAGAWMECKDAGVSHVPYAGTTLLEVVNRRLDEIDESDQS